jgi:Ca2+-binding RTX toxin-like protein
MAYVSGTTNSDLLNAADGITFGDDDVYGGDGNDTIYGLGGNDNLFGEDGRDKLYGSIGHDWLEGGKNHDDLFGGDNDDVLFGGAGDDELYGEKTTHDFLMAAPASIGRPTTTGRGVQVSLNPFLLIGGIRATPRAISSPISSAWSARGMATSSTGTIKPTGCTAWKATTCWSVTAATTSSTAALATTCSTAVTGPTT